jgi:ABC-2 type transport system permease protein
MLAYISLEIRRMLRHRRYFVVGLGFPAFFYGLVTTTGMSAGPDTKIAGTTWGVYFMVSMATWSLLMTAFSVGGSRISAERSSGWLRQLQASPLRPVDYIVGKLVAGLVMSVPALVLMAGLAIVWNGVSLEPLVWLELGSALLAGSLVFGLLALLAGFLFDVDSATVAANVIIFGFGVLGGLFTPIEEMPGTIANVARSLPSWRLADVGWRIVGGRSQDVLDVAIVVAFGVAFALLAAWRFRTDTATA